MKETDTVIEKELGQNEKMIVKSNNLIAFTKSVWIEKHPGVLKEKGGDFLKLTGPGLVYFEITNDFGVISGMMPNSERPRSFSRLFFFVFFITFMFILNSINFSLLFA